MTSEELFTQVSALVESLRTRILGTGKEQYDMGNTQKIETFSEIELLTNTVEEIDDAIVYLAHLRARLSVIAKRFE